jgi:hypothetical protein
MKKHPVQRLLESQGIRTFSYNGRFESSIIKCLGAYCTLGGLLRAVSVASVYFIDSSDLSSFVTDVSDAATNSGRLFYWANIRFVEREYSTTNLAKEI